MIEGPGHVPMHLIKENVAPLLQPGTIMTNAATSSLPASSTVHVGELQVPFREIELSASEPPFRVYDTSGPQGHEVMKGLPPLRAGWIGARGEYEASDLLSEVHKLIGQSAEPSELPDLQEAVNA